mgnify:FL=1
MSLHEGFYRLLEQDALPPAGQPPAPAPAAPAAPPTGQETPPPAQPGAAPADGSPLGSDGKPITLDSVLERLNVIRGGKSFADPEVYGQLTSMFKTMTNDDKISLDRLLGEIGKVVINMADAQVQGTQDQAAAQQQGAAAQPAAGPAAAAPPPATPAAVPPPQ